MGNILSTAGQRLSKFFTTPTTAYPFWFSVAVFACIAFYFFHEVPRNEADFIDDQFQDLADAGDQLRSEISNYVLVVNAEVAREKASEVAKLPDDLNSDEPDSNLFVTCDPNSHLVTPPSGTGSLTPNSATVVHISSVHGEDVLRVEHLEHMSAKGPVRDNDGICLEIPLKRTMDAIFESLRDNFDAIAIVMGDGEVIYQRAEGSTRLGDIGDLLESFYESGRWSGYTAGPQAAQSDSEHKPKGKQSMPPREDNWAMPGFPIPPADWRRSSYTSLLDAKFGQQSYKLLVQSIAIQIPVQPEHSTDLTGYQLNIVGVISSSRLTAKSHQVPLSLASTFATLVVLLLLILWPILKVSKMGRTEGISRLEIVFLVYSVIVWISIFTLEIVYLLSRHSHAETDTHLSRLTRQIDNNLTSEIGTELALLQAVRPQNNQRLLDELKAVSKNIAGDPQKHKIFTCHKYTPGQQVPQGYGLCSGAILDDAKSSPRDPLSSAHSHSQGWDKSFYPWFDIMYWLDQDGHMLVKWSTKEHATPPVRVNNLEWFKAAINGALWKPSSAAQEECVQKLKPLGTNSTPKHPSLRNAQPSGSGVSKVDTDFETQLRDLCRQPFLANTTYSPNTAEYLSFVIQPVRKEKEGLLKNNPATIFSQGNGSLAAAVLISPLMSVEHPIMPPGYDFAIVDRSGLVIYHSQSTRDLREHLLARVDSPQVLRHAIQFGEEATMVAQYHGHRVRMHTHPFSGAINAPWVIIAYYDLDRRDEFLFGAQRNSVIALTLYLIWLVLLGFMVLSIYWIRRWLIGSREDHSANGPGAKGCDLHESQICERKQQPWPPWFAPTGAKVNKFLFLLIANLIIALLYFWMWTRFDGWGEWLLMLSCPPALLVFGIAILRTNSDATGMPNAPQTAVWWRNRDWWARRVAVAVLAFSLCSISVFPAATIFRAAFNDERVRQIEHEQLILRSALYSRLVPMRSLLMRTTMPRNASPGTIEEHRWSSCYDRYDTLWFNKPVEFSGIPSASVLPRISNIQEANDRSDPASYKATSEQLCGIKETKQVSEAEFPDASCQPTENPFYCKISQSADWLAKQANFYDVNVDPDERGCNRDSNCAAQGPDYNAWVAYPERFGSTILLVLRGYESTDVDQYQKLAIVTTLPRYPVHLWEVAVLSLSWLIVMTVLLVVGLQKRFGWSHHFKRVWEVMDRWPREGEFLFVVSEDRHSPFPKSIGSKAAELKELEIRQLVYASPEPTNAVVVLRGLEEYMQEGYAREQVLRVLETLVTRRDLAVIVVSTIDPVYYLFEDIIGRSESSYSPEQLAAYARWFQIFRQFKEPLRYNKAFRQGEMQPSSPTHDMMREKAIWDTCTRQEKMVLWQLGTDGVANPKNRQALEHLIQRGVVRQDDSLMRISDCCLYQYVRCDVCEKEVKSLFPSDEETAWHSLRWILIYASIGSAVVFLLRYASIFEGSAIRVLTIGGTAVVPLAKMAMGMLKKDTKADT